MTSEGSSSRLASSSSHNNAAQRTTASYALVGAWGIARPCSASAAMVESIQLVRESELGYAMH